MYAHALRARTVRAVVLALSLGFAFTASAGRVLAQTGAAPGSTGAASARIGSNQTSGGVRAGSYRLQPGDLLQYRVWPDVELTGDFPVESSGLVYLPRLGGVAVGGKTLDEVRGQLRDMYSKLVQGSTQPVVTVTAQFGFSVTGGVGTSGIFDGNAGMTVFDAISRAGGYRNDATPKYVDVVHSDGTTTHLETADAGNGTSGLTSVLLQSQDRIIVPVAHRKFTTQNMYLVLQMAIGIVTAIKVLAIK